MVLAEGGAAGYWWVPVLTATLGVIGGLLEWTRRTVRTDREQAQEARHGTHEDRRAVNERIQAVMDVLDQEIAHRIDCEQRLTDEKRERKAEIARLDRVIGELHHGRE